MSWSAGPAGIRNAIEAMEGCPLQQLTVSTTLESPEMVRVSVRDTGPGIDPEVQNQLFQAFVTTKSSGTGLGLSICRTIIDAHGGAISARAASGGGTEFQFTLPRADGVIS